MKKIIFLMIMTIFTALKAYSEGLEDWKAVLFAGLAKGNSPITSVTVSNFASSGANDIYAINFKTLPIQPGQSIPDAKMNLMKFSWIGNSWSIEEYPVQISSLINTLKHLNIFKIENEYRLYIGSLGGTIYEFDNLRQSPRLKSKIDGQGSLANMLSYIILNNNSDYYICRGNASLNENERQFEVYKWNSSEWQPAYNAFIYKWFNPDQNKYSYSDICYLCYGKGRGTEKNYLYAKYLHGERISELEQTGDSWIESSKIDMILDSGFAEEKLGRQQILIDDAGNGLKLYVIYNYDIYECTRKSGKWHTKNISDCGRIYSMACGRISREDPVSIYALISNFNTDDFLTENNASEILEYTYTNRVGTWRYSKKAWRETYRMKLYEKSISRPKIPDLSITDIYMANGRNEKEIDNEGNEVDKYQRVYVVDHWGNLWECSIPPRILRPENIEEPAVPADQPKPSILGK